MKVIEQKFRTLGLVGQIFSKSRSEDKLHRIHIESIGTLETQNYQLSGSLPHGGGREHLFGVSHPSESTEFSTIVSLASKFGYYL